MIDLPRHGSGLALSARLATLALIFAPALYAQGNVRRFVNIYVNGEDIRFLQDKDTPVKPGEEVSIVPAIAGGR